MTVLRDVMALGRRLRRLTSSLGCGLMLSLFPLGACSDDDDEPTTENRGGSGGTGGRAAAGAGGSAAAGRGGSGGGSGVESPTTHLELINACTDAEKVDVDPDLPLLLPDGKLPPLP
jgi:hypothetical protein